MFVATVISYRGLVLRVYAEAETLEEMAGYRFCLCLRYRGRDVETGANLKLWPGDLIHPVRDALAAGRDIDMRHYARDERTRRRAARAKAKVIVELSDENDELARELGLI